MTVYKYGQDDVNDYIAAHKTYGGLTWETWIIHGRSGNDTLVGGDDNDYLRGEADNDTLIGRYDNDVLEGGAGDDVLYGYTATGVGRSDEKDFLDGGTGADTMYGGDGDDTYIVDNVGDRVIEYANQGTDLVKSSIFSYTLTTNAENLILVGSSSFSGYGNSLNNYIEGNSNSNLLYGYDSSDTLYGLDGIDRLVGGNGGDYLSGGNGADFIFADNETSGDGGWYDTLFGGASDDTLYAGDGLDTLWGDLDPGNSSFTGNDKLYSGTDSFADNMFGGRGNDTYYLRGPGVVIEHVGEGTDTIVSISSNSLGHFQNIENLTLDGTAKNASGNNEGNVLTGNAQNNTLSGGDGGDALKGGDGLDVLYGDDGSDTLRGGNHADVLVGYLVNKPDYENDTLWGEGGGDRFVLGSATTAYYALHGNTDYANIMDYSYSSGDRIQVFGSSATLSNYSLSQTKNFIGAAALDTEIYYRGSLIAVVADNSTMTRNEFIFSGQ